MLRTVIDSLHGLRFVNEETREALFRHEQKHREVKHRRFNERIDAEINALMQARWDSVADTVISKCEPAYGYINLFEHEEFYVHTDDEIACELKEKTRKCYPVPW